MNRRLMITTLALLPISAMAQTMTPEQFRSMLQSEIERDPGFIIDSLNRHVQRQEEARNRVDPAVLSLVHTLPDRAVGGAANGSNVTVFSDYNCPHCKSFGKSLFEAMKQNPNIRAKMIEMPVLGQRSVDASRVGQAVSLIDANQGWALYERLKDVNGPIGANEAIEAAIAVGVDRIKLLTMMSDPRVNALLAENSEIAKRMNFQGTPLVIIDNTVFRGAIPVQQILNSTKK